MVGCNERSNAYKSNMRSRQRKIQAERWAEMPMSFIWPFSSILLDNITLTLEVWKKIVTLSKIIGIIMKELYNKKFGFEVLGDNIKVFH